MRVLRYMDSVRLFVQQGREWLRVQGLGVVRRTTPQLSGNGSIWRDRRLTEQGAKYADEAMPLMLSALKAARIREGDAVAKAVFEEALWQLTQLPKLEDELQERLRWKHP